MRVVFAIDFENQGLTGEGVTYARAESFGYDAVTDYISAKSFLLLKRDRAMNAGDGPETAPISETYGDYRNIEGVTLPFSSVTEIPSFGRIVGKVKEIKFDIDFPDATFRATAK